MILPYPAADDAARDRELILGAPREVFAENGLDASMREAAQRAGVGEPTLPGRFSSNEELVSEAFADKVAVHANRVQAMLKDPNPGAGVPPLRRRRHRAGAHGSRMPCLGRRPDIRSALAAVAGVPI